MDIKLYIKEWYKAGNSRGNISLDIDEIYVANNSNWSKAKIQSAMNLYQDDLKQEALRKLRVNISCDKENLEPLSAFVAALGADQKCVYALAHWVANVKRKVLNIKANNHKLLIFEGTVQGQGKSTAMNYLCKPLAGYCADTTLSMVTEDSSFAGLSGVFIAKIDELASGTRKFNTSDFKRIITSDETTTRTLHTNNITTNKTTFSLIATTNFGIGSVYNDPSGMRRFYQLHIPGVVNWHLINVLNYDELWRGVDENRDYYTLAKAEFEDNSLNLMDNKRTFFDECVAPGDMFIPHAEVYERYRAWCAAKGLQPQDGAKPLKLPNCETDKQYYNGKQCRGYLISEDCELAKKTQKVVQLRTHPPKEN